MTYFIAAIIEAGKSQDDTMGQKTLSINELYINYTSKSTKNFGLTALYFYEAYDPHLGHIDAKADTVLILSYRNQEHQSL